MICNRCHQDKPYTPNYFEPYRYGLRRTCRECRNAKRKQYKQRRNRGNQIMQAARELFARLDTT